MEMLLKMVLLLRRHRITHLPQEDPIRITIILDLEHIQSVLMENHMIQKKGWQLGFW